jgi:hypothetical protein
LPPPRTLRLGNDIRPYLEQPGNQIIIVPNGTYTAGELTGGHHPETSGPLKGWLVVEAETPHRVVVDLTKAPLTLDRSASRILFVGFTFVNGPIDEFGTDIAFWYTDHSFSTYEWKVVEHEKYQFPHTIRAYADTTLRAAFYGSDIHDTGHGIDLSNSTDTLIEGVHVYNIDDQGLDPKHSIHLDAIDAVSGNMNGLIVTDSWLQGFTIFEDSNGKTGGPDHNLTLEHSWLSDSPAAGIQFVSNRGHRPRGVFGKMIDVHIWSPHNGYPRTDIIDYTQHHVGNTRPGRIDVTETALATSPPPTGAPSPADLWRRNHRYNDWIIAIR